MDANAQVQHSYNLIGRAVPTIAQLPDIVPCAPLNVTLPASPTTALNLELRMANLGKVVSSGYALGLDVTLPSQAVQTFPSNQAIFHIKLQREATIPAQANNAKVEVFYGGKEFSRSNNTISFTIQ